ncbi:MAG: putative lipid II flippase FtsW [Candidatus Omnitrophica bacterium]|nr:putative lipid II flippase FtsW [Candidatus Omnitrophota bacterium]
MTDRELRRVLAAIIAALLGVGCVAVYSTTAMMADATYGNTWQFLANHLVAIVLGLGCALACLAVPYATLRRMAKPMVLISVVALVAVLLFGREVGGAQRWFRLGRLSVQPSEFAKLALIVYLADFLARRQEQLQEFRRGFLPPMLVAGLMAGLILLQPDLGTATALGAVAVIMLVVARATWSHLGLTLAAAMPVLVLLVAGEAYRRRRILAFLNPWQDPQGVGFQILQSFFAMGRGGVWGSGLGMSVQKLFYLPGAHTDFIFAIIGEEMGLVGTTVVLGLFALFVSCGVRMAHAAEDPFSRYLICGCVGLIGLQAVVHMAVVTGLMPTKGLPLPLVSYGGTSIVSSLIACSLIIHASRHGRRAWEGGQSAAPEPRASRPWTAPQGAARLGGVPAEACSQQSH